MSEKYKKALVHIWFTLSFVRFVHIWCTLFLFVSDLISFLFKLIDLKAEPPNEILTLVRGILFLILFSVFTVFFISAMID